MKRIEDWARGGRVHGRSQAVRALIDKSILALMPRQSEPRDPEFAKSVAYAQKLLDASIAVVGACHINLNAQGARDPKIVALSLLCRSISNFRASVRLAQQDQPSEARAMVRLLNENLLWIGSLREKRAEFVKEMIEEERHNQKVLAQVTLDLTRKHGGDIASDGALQLRNIVRKLSGQSKGQKTLKAAEVASAGVVELAYVEYLRFSLDGVHCSVTALGKHLSREEGELTLSIVPNTSPSEQLDTVLHACRALMGVAVAANEMVGFTSASELLSAAVDEFERNGWRF
ncbi:DUF5677 domain-containing protein [Bradyrhizobium erythrophlei]|uniref:DUF5677 domain-containing protein n=1 Tax=Bradyrhizobium erythrophlei TaxID=1437360 RepID=UPI0012EC045F|nr:DUF5677 domain-containing protein [Bradyrhizobium erythrophlei]